MMKMLMLGAALASRVLGAALAEPEGNKILYGAWVDTENRRDTPAQFNQRLGKKTSIVHFAQTIPNPYYNSHHYNSSYVYHSIPEHLLDETESDASIMLTVYPNNGFGSIKNLDYSALANQVAYYEVSLKRQVFLRYAPEMQGTWNVYGQRPSEFIDSFRKVHDSVKRVAPNTVIIWAPNLAHTYPWGQSFGGVSEHDQKLLDTNNNGVLDAQDDPYSPYYPGDEYVDWSGLSVYYKGPWTATNNTLLPDGYCEAIIHGRDPTSGERTADFYNTYCTREDTACMFAESGAAYTPSEGGVSHADFQRQWLQGCTANTSFYDAHPRLKMVMQFEFAKIESAINGKVSHDYRVTYDEDVRNVTVAALDQMPGYFVWGNSTSTRTPLSGRRHIIFT